jgi:hypothetical protein
MLDCDIAHRFDGTSCGLAALKRNLHELSYGKQSAAANESGLTDEVPAASGLSKAKTMLVH